MPGPVSGEVVHWKPRNPHIIDAAQNATACGLKAPVAAPDTVSEEPWNPTCLVCMRAALLVLEGAVSHLRAGIDRYRRLKVIPLEPESER